MKTKAAKNGKNRIDSVLAPMQEVAIAAPNLRVVDISIRGDAPYVQHKFSAKARGKMRVSQEEGAKSRGKRARDPRDFEMEAQEATHVSPEGWCGIPAPAFRAAMISACRIAGLVMTRAKLSIFVRPDGFDADDGTPLVRITKGEPAPHEASVRLESGVASVVVRPMWAPGWEATVSVRYDADQFDAQSVANLLARAGLQVGVGEGRPDSKKSCGLGWGTFALAAAP